MRDQMAAAWVLIVGAVFIGLYYWRTHPTQAKTKPKSDSGGGGSFTGSDSGGGGTLPPVLPPVPGAPGAPLNGQNSLPWPPEVLKEWSLPQGVQNQHHNAILQQFGIKSSFDIDGGESQLAQETL